MHSVLWLYPIGGRDVDRKELWLEDNPGTLGRIKIYELTISDTGKEIRRTIVCEMNAYHPEWREYAGRFIGAVNARGT